MGKSIKQILRTAALLAFALSASAHAAESCPPAPVAPTPAQIQAARQKSADHGFMWRISKDGRTSYLYGTMHLGKLEWVFPGLTVTQALRATDTLALEIDSLDPDVRTRTAKAMAAARNTPLPEPLEKRMRKMAAAACVPYETVAKIMPEMRAAVLAALMARKDGLELGYAIDPALSAFGHQAKKNVVSLESPESQIKAIQMDTPEETVALIKSSLDEMEQDAEHPMLGRIGQIWATSDYAEMGRFEQWCDCLNTAEERKLMKRMLDDRNPVMAERIDALHAGGKRVFAAVGSLHMFGPLGLPVLMEKRGYKVERVDFKPR